MQTELFPEVDVDEVLLCAEIAALHTVGVRHWKTSELGVLVSLTASDRHFESPQILLRLQLDKSPANADRTEEMCDHGQITLTPSESRKRILLVASGMTPQVVTETLYALAVRSRNTSNIAISHDSAPCGSSDESLY